MRFFLSLGVVFLALVFSSGVSFGRSDEPLDVGAVTVEGDLNGFTQTLETTELEPGLRLVKLHLSAEQPVRLKPLTMRFSFPSVDINGFWNSSQSLDKVNYYSNAITSGASGAAPLIALYNNQLQNRLTFAASDALNPIELRCSIREEDVRFHASLRLFGVAMPPTTSYTLELLFDSRAVPYYEAIDHMRTWWETQPGLSPAPVPDLARRPVYSTWYNFHQGLDADVLVAECARARAVGCRTIIVDDGWQTTDGNRGYAYTGDWRPERLTNMRGFVDRVHAEDMRVVLWYSLPFMGEHATNFERFRGKFLYHWQSQGAFVLDPRYPEVREYMLETYVRALEDWNLDGFKLDFIGWFRAQSETVMTAEDGRDFASVAAATDHLMTELTTRLRALRPDVLLEFRQPYVGPVMRKYGNMFRGVDCPNNAAANRNEIANLRLLSGSTAVHSDMFVWRQEEPTHSAALQVLNVLFGVPQVSVVLADLPPEHERMLAFWLGYWNANREVLLDGRFKPGNPGANYPSLTATLGGHQITALYETSLARRSEPSVVALDLINATGAPVLYLDLTEAWPDCHITVTDCLGATISEETRSLGAGPVRFDVPLSGMVQLRGAR